MQRWTHPARPLSLERADALERYEHWPEPTCILADGPYGIRGFQGDTASPQGLPSFYAPHVEAWSRRAGPRTSLWFWGTEVGWASVHPILEQHGWRYQQLIVWDKGISHVAGNVNSKTIRSCPVVTEVAALYRREVRLPAPDGTMLPLQLWLRNEWLRSGLALKAANTACGVASAASRKYLTTDDLFYFPPAEMMARLATYANEHGDPRGRPYVPLPYRESTPDADGSYQRLGEAWQRQRDLLTAPWNHEHGISNVWTHPALRGTERIRDEKGKVVHPNQKPLVFIERQVRLTTKPGDHVWEPFAGLAPGAIAAERNGCSYSGAEITPATFRAARKRLERVLP
jgi:site-specific DNA-methyltransferase (adenine-specific)